MAAASTPRRTAATRSRWARTCASSTARASRGASVVVRPTCPTGYTGEAPCCIAPGEQCQFKDQCCGGAPCVPGADGGLVCTVESCTAVGAACTSSTQCCSGTECRATTTGGNACQPKPPPSDAGTPDAGSCQGNGSLCNSPADCCSDRCLEGACQPPAACQPQGSVCTTTADCCSGYSCAVPAGSTSGTCQSSTCAGSGQSCTGTNQCCTGLQCLDPTFGPCSGTADSGTADCSCKVLIN